MMMMILGMMMMMMIAMIVMTVMVVFRTWQYCNAAAARLISPPQQTMQLHTWNNIDEKYFYLKCNSGDAGQNKDAKFVVSEICLIYVGNLKPNVYGL